MYDKVQPNDKYGRLTLISRFQPEDGRQHARWNVKCECGTRKTVDEQMLLSGETKSCGCLMREIIGDLHTTHGATRGGKRLPLYDRWMGMLDRCRNSKAAQFADYGGRGIEVCAAWHDFAVFKDWALANGYAENLCIDRIDNDGGYEPSNCKWSTRTEQANNRRSSHKLTAFGETKNITTWARDPRCTVSRMGLLRRINAGMAPEAAISSPVDVAGAQGRDRLYLVWRSTLNRCRLPSVADYANYGGRGITVCDAWLDYKTFSTWATEAGYAPGLCLDRKNNDGNYEPENCKWTTRTEQANNRRSNFLITAFGETKNITAWSRDPRCVITRVGLLRRLQAGESPEAAITLPLHTNSGHPRGSRKVAHSSD